MDTAHDESRTQPEFDRAEFDRRVDKLVAGLAPRMFAVVEELGDPDDVRVAAWGLAHPARADMVDVDGTAFYALDAADGAVMLLGNGPDRSARVVWIDG